MQLQFKEDSSVEAVGDLTIKGVTKEVTIKMGDCSGRRKDVRKDTQVVFTGGTTINRKEFGVSGDNWSRIKEGITAVAFDVEIELSILRIQINAPNFTNWVDDPNTPHGKIYKMISESNVENGIQEFKKMKEWKIISKVGNIRIRLCIFLMQISFQTTRYGSFDIDVGDICLHVGCRPVLVIPIEKHLDRATKQIGSNVTMDGRVLMKCRFHLVPFAEYSAIDVGLNRPGDRFGDPIRVSQQ